MYKLFLNCIFLLRRLQLTFGVDGTTHRWFQSYLHGRTQYVRGRTQYVRRGLLRSTIYRLLCGVPQGSVLALLLFILYTIDLIQLVEKHGMSPHLYTDDTQVSGSCCFGDVNTFSSSVSKCIGDISCWMKSNSQLNSSKIEVMWCSTSRRQHLQPTSALSIDGNMVDPVTSLRDLGIFIDADLVMRTEDTRETNDIAVLRRTSSVETDSSTGTSSHWW
jgi:hypothetical protein